VLCLEKRKSKKYPRNFLCLSSHVSMVVTKTIELLSLESSFIANETLKSKMNIFFNTE